MEYLAAINICLKAAGLAPVNVADPGDPDYSEVDGFIEEAKRITIGDGYPFNTDYATLSPDPGNSNKVSVEGYLKVCLPEHLSTRSNYVWNPETMTFHTESLDVYVVSDVAWDAIPVEFQEAIANRAAVDYLASKKGMVPELAYYNNKAQVLMARAEALYPVDSGKANGAYRLLGRYRWQR